MMCYECVRNMWLAKPGGEVYISRYNFRVPTCRGRYTVSANGHVIYVSENKVYEALDCVNKPIKYEKNEYVDLLMKLNKRYEWDRLEDWYRKIKPTDSAYKLIFGRRTINDLKDKKHKL